MLFLQTLNFNYTLNETLYYVEKNLFNHLFVICFISCFCSNRYIKRNYIDGEFNDPLPFANVIVEKDGDQYGGTTTDFDGNFTISNVEPGNYSVKATFVGYGTIEVTGVIISANKITFQNVKLQEGVALGE